MATILLKIKSEKNEWRKTGSGGHWLRLGVFTLNVIIAISHLLPAFLASDALNIIIIMIMGATTTVMVVSEGARKTCKKLKWKKKGIWGLSWQFQNESNPGLNLAQGNLVSDATPCQCHTYQHWRGKSIFWVTVSRAAVVALPPGTLFFTWIRLLAALDIIPMTLLNLNPPKCAECLYVYMTKCPWRTKTKNNRGSIREAFAPR